MISNPIISICKIRFDAYWMSEKSDRMSEKSDRRLLIFKGFPLSLSYLLISLSSFLLFTISFLSSFIFIFSIFILVCYTFVHVHTPVSGSLEFRDLPGYSRALSFSCSLCFSHNLLIPFSLFPKLQGDTGQRGYGGRLWSPPQLADASLKRATDVAQTNERSCFHIQKQLEPFFFFLSFSFLLYPIYRACYLFQISPPCLSMSPEVSFSRMFIWSSNKDF